MTFILVLLCVVLAALLDRFLGEPKRLHPLVGFGKIAKLAEYGFNTGPWRRFRGVLSWSLCVLPWGLLAVVIEHKIAGSLIGQVIIGSLVLYLALGWRSLILHAQDIVAALNSNDVDGARSAVSRIVSRDTDQLNEEQVALAATESVLENGSDAIFAAIFWFVIAGLPGVVVYRLSNTLDAMWGYKTSRYKKFGWWAARVDDVLNYIPARLTAFSYALMGNWTDAMHSWRAQGSQWKSPNAGPVMASGAGALGLRLGGDTCYRGELLSRPLLGLSDGKLPSVSSIEGACELINRCLGLWLVCLGITALMAFLMLFH